MKIDIVYTWVNGSDADWNKKRIETAGRLGNVLPEANNNARFMDNDELKFSLRSIYKYAPWVNNIFIITDNQKPDWLNISHPKINIIDHKEIFSNPDWLPSFSARGIESQIHHIKKLSEHFIYFNDDMFLGSESKPEHFFTSKGKPYIFVSESIPIPKKKAFDISKRSKDKLNEHQYAIVNSRSLIKEKFNKPVYYNIRHGSKPILKSALAELENVFNNELVKTAKNNFRTKDDILMIHLFSFYAIAKKLGKAKYLRSVSKKKKLGSYFSSANKFTFGYINLHEKNIETNLKYIKKNKPLLMCLNQTPLTPVENLKKIDLFLNEYYPEKSSFEL
ncbi:MAG: Stealth CR1 domain-containing protein [Melioribacteraceae bacterium]|nr:Stealth CR1 domain-containing protein [Melioribacteraceae bacterium]